MQARIQILYLGEALWKHPSHRPYIDRKIAGGGWQPETVYLRPEDDPGLMNLLSSGDDAPLLVFADADGSARIAELLAQTNEANPPGEKVRTYNIKGKSITVIQTSPGEPLPPLPLKKVPHRTFHSFPEENVSAKHLQKQSGQTRFDCVEILPGWLRFDAYGPQAASAWADLSDVYKYRSIPGNSLVESLIHYLASIEKKITFAESCTGGLIAATFTAEPGASEILEGSYVTYANRIKAGWLGVREETLREFGAVSRECVLEMAAGAQRNLDADIAIAVSGIAGPTGAVPGKPVGTVWVCLRNGESARTERLQLHGDRNAVQEQTVLFALKFLVESEKEKIFEFFSKKPLTE